jgi:dipeptidyl aminopeptidase/acylaminoacyl peptidase
VVGRSLQDFIGFPLRGKHPKADCSDLVLHPTTYEVEAVGVTVARQEWVHIAPGIATDFALLQSRLNGFEFSVQSQTDDNRRWIVMAHKAEQPATYYLLDRDERSLTELFRARPALAHYRLAPMHSVQSKSRDGLDLVSYLTLPADIKGERPSKPFPMVLIVHGGPWFRDSYGYRGDAAKMHDDLIDMVEWAISEGIAQRDKVAIFGTSYGGLASFIGATFTPDVFCCSVPVVGITNLQTLLESMPPYWAGFAEFMYRSYGDPRTPEGRALLAERSPIHKVDPDAHFKAPPCHGAALAARTECPIIRSPLCNLDRSCRPSAKGHFDDAQRSDELRLAA